MTLTDILSGSENASEQLKKIFVLKTFKSKIGNAQFETRYFTDRVQRTILNVVNGNLSAFGIYGRSDCIKCCEGPSTISTPSENKIPEDMKKELVEFLKKSTFKALDNYKSELDDLFGGQEAPKEASTETENRGEIEGNDATESEPSVSTQEALGQV